jgi:hypothetical protein
VGRDPRVFDVAPEAFDAVPGKPFAYWVSNGVLELFDLPPFDDENAGRTTRCGLGTLDDFRFLRLFWETRRDDTINNWRTYFHGGTFRRFYDNFNLMVNWGKRGAEIKSYVEAKVGSASRKVQGEDKYLQAGFVFPRRTKGFCPKFMPGGGIFSTGGKLDSRQQTSWHEP